MFNGVILILTWYHLKLIIYDYLQSQVAQNSWQKHWKWNFNMAITYRKMLRLYVICAWEAAQNDTILDTFAVCWTLKVPNQLILFIPVPVVIHLIKTKWIFARSAFEVHSLAAMIRGLITGSHICGYTVCCS